MNKKNGKNGKRREIAKKATLNLFPLT